MECKRSVNTRHCNCSYSSCNKTGLCCDCLAYHLTNRELPACCFPDDIERTYDRSFERFAKWVLNEEQDAR